jgi:hypothetical protein
MTLVGVHLTVLIGATVPTPAPPVLLEALDKIEVTHSDAERSGFQIVFRAPRDPVSIIDYPIIANPLLRPGNRVILTITIGVVPEVLFDGIITHQQLNPAPKPGDTTFTVTGEDVSVAMDREEKAIEHTAQPETVIAYKIIGSYPQFGFIPEVIPPPSFDAPVPAERTPVQRATDLGYLVEMAKRYAYVFFVTPGPVPGSNLAYWGPPPRVGLPQPAISVDLGPDTNVKSISFQNNEAQATAVQGSVQDRQTNTTVPVRTFTSTRPPLALFPGLANPALAGVRAYKAEGARTATQATAEAQAQTDASTDIITVDGELDIARYNGLLKARGLVGLRGVGFTYDGLYYVKSVTSAITREGFTQKFTATREGTGSTVPVVRV